MRVAEAYSAAAEPIQAAGAERPDPHLALEGELDLFVLSASSAVAVEVKRIQAALGMVDCFVAGMDPCSKRPWQVAIRTECQTRGESVDWLCCVHRCGLAVVFPDIRRSGDCIVEQTARSCTDPGATHFLLQGPEDADDLLLKTELAGLPTKAEAE